jgi:hypothetical protein
MPPAGTAAELAASGPHAISLRRLDEGEPGVAGGPTILVLNGPNLNLLGVR